MPLQKFLSKKKLSRKYRSIFGLKNQSCERRNKPNITNLWSIDCVDLKNKKKHHETSWSWKIGEMGEGMCLS